MPSSTMEHEDQWKLPKDTLFAGRLTAVKEREIKYRNRDGEDSTFVKWEWEFSIDEGEHAGLRAWGDTEDKITNRVDNKAR